MNLAKFKEKINDSRLTSEMKLTRSRGTQLFRKDYGDREFTSTENADVILKHESPEMYAQLIDKEWYWVKGCSKCEDSMNYGENHSYQVCYEHNRCVDCKTHRQDLKDIPWGVSNGFRCKPCQDKIDKETLKKALEKRKDMDDSDFHYADSVLCPYCSSDNGTDDFSDGKYECHVCGDCFSLTISCTVEYSTDKI